VTGSTATAPRVAFTDRAGAVPWLAQRFARKPGAAPEQAIGLLHAHDPELRGCAQKVAVEAPRQLGRLDEIHLRGRLVLRDHHADAKTLEELVHEAVRIAAAGLNGPKRRSCEIAALEARLQYAEDFLRRREGEIARRMYAHDLLRGVVMTFIALAVIGGLGAAVIRAVLNGPLPADQGEALRDVLVAVGAGAAGACVSVLLRLHRVRNLTIEVADSGAAQYRIYLGWFFAAAVVFFLKSGLLSAVFTIPEDSVASWFFWGSVGFLAGFNERWATSLISRSSGDGGREGSTDPGPSGRIPHKK